MSTSPVKFINAPCFMQLYLVLTLPLNMPGMHIKSKTGNWWHTKHN